MVVELSRVRVELYYKLLCFTGTYVGGYEYNIVHIIYSFYVLY